MSCAPKITEQYIERCIQNGMGQGHGRAYLPWIQIKRWNPSSVSTQGIGGLPPYFRKRCAFMSRNEWRVALVLSWIASDVREQFPAWPWPHAHPLYGLNQELDLELTWSVGMREICTEMGIRHGTYIGTSIPYIWTFDFVLTLRVIDTYRCAVCSIKPIEDDRYLDPDPLDRAMEKLEAERRYCKHLKIAYSVTGSSQFDETLMANLEVFRGAAVVPMADRRYAILQNFLDKRLDMAKMHPIDDWILWMRHDSGANLSQAIFIVQHIIWNQLVDVDLTQPFDKNRLIKPGGRALRKSLRKALLEGAL